MLHALRLPEITIRHGQDQGLLLRKVRFPAKQKLGCNPSRHYNIITQCMKCGLILLLSCTALRKHHDETTRGGKKMRKICPVNGGLRFCPAKAKTDSRLSLTSWEPGVGG